MTFVTSRVAQHAQPAARLFLWGESMGGGLGFLVAQRLEVSHKSLNDLFSVNVPGCFSSIVADAAAGVRGDPRGPHVRLL